MMFVYFSTLLESILKSGLLPSSLLAGKNWVGIVGVGIVGVGIIAPTRCNQFSKCANPKSYLLVRCAADLHVQPKRNTASLSFVLNYFFKLRISEQITADPEVKFLEPRLGKTADKKIANNEGHLSTNNCLASLIIFDYLFFRFGMLNTFWKLSILLIRWS